MDLRDHFAGCALAGLLSDSNHPLYPDKSSLCDERRMAICAYRIADFMMAAREQKEKSVDVQPT